MMFTVHLLPVMNMLIINQDDEITFTNGKSKLDDIDTYTKYLDR